MPSFTDEFPFVSCVIMFFFSEIDGLSEGFYSEDIVVD